MMESGHPIFRIGFDVFNRVNPSTSCAPNLVSFCYDAAGDMLMDNHNHAFTYDGEARIKTVDGTAATYTYNPLGNRVRKDTGATSTEYFFFGGNVIAELNPSTGAYTDYIFGYGKRIAKDTSSNGSAAQYYHDDQIGSARVMTDAAGNKIMDCTFNPFGEQVVCSPDNASNHYRFTGKEHDSESQLDDFGARYFSSSMGRWMTPDWSANPATVPYADLNDPQTLNLYGYMRSNPLSQADLDGHGGCTIDGEAHGRVWCWFHSLGFVHTQKEQADKDRTELNQSGVIFFDKHGNRVDLSKLPDAQVIKLYGQYQSNQIPPLASSVFMTQWGWSGGRPYREARDQLKQPGTHETLNGKVPTQDEAVQMIRESGGEINRIEEGHGPDSVSPHDQPHINYTTAGGQKATVYIQAVTH